MNRSRIPWVAVGLLSTCLAGLILACATLSGFGAAANGDVAISSSSVTTNMLIAFGAIGLLSVDLAHGRLHPGRNARTVRSRDR
jgi:hypothetical protein